MIDQRLQRFQHTLRCPSCHGSLLASESNFACTSCDVVYSLANGCPILLSEASYNRLESVLAAEYGQEMVAEYEASKAAVALHAKKSLIDYLRPPSIMHRYVDDLNKSPASVLFHRDGRPQLTLNVGGGPHRENQDEITMNLRPFVNVDMVGDAHNIPVADNSFDSVLSMAVLEHVSNPQQVVHEMIRVLKPGGYLYTEVPFIFFFHGYPTDYTRFTIEGMKQLFSGLKDAQFGLTYGPVSAVLQSANMLLELLIPARLGMLRKLANGMFRWLFFVFKYLDIPLRNHPDAHKLAAGFYVLGRKPLG